MLQIILMIIGLIFLIRLIFMTKKTGADRVINAEKLADWQSYKRLQYIWMIGSGWGSAAVGYILGQVAITVLSSTRNLTSDNILITQIILFIISIAVMYFCYRASAYQEKKAAALEGRKR
jgi:hypothetical protein